MKNKITVIRRVRPGISGRFLKQTLNKTLRAAKVVTAAALTVVWTDDREVRAMNRRTRNCNQTTDVLSFPLYSVKELKSQRRKRITLELGDIAISVPEARREARRRAVSQRAESALLLVHGCLHLLGFDHRRALERKKMFGLQSRILQSLGVREQARGIK